MPRWLLIIVLAVLLALAIVTGWLIDGLITQQDEALIREAATLPGDTPEIVIDGDMSDWPNGVTALADEHWLYLRVDLPNPVTLQAAQLTRAIEVDWDADPTTGSDGTDLEIVFSPPPKRKGARITIHKVGKRRNRSHAAVDLMFAPTYASTAFEVWLSRHRAAKLLGRDIARPLKGRVIVHAPGGVSGYWSSHREALGPGGSIARS